MNHYITLLERCGFEVFKRPRHKLWRVNYDDWCGTAHYTDNQLKAKALEVGAEKAAEWLNENNCRTFAPRWACQRRLDKYLSDLELINEAKGCPLFEGLEL